MLFDHYTKKQRLSDERGFSLIEMMVVLIIFAILTAIVIFQYNKFNARILVTNMAYEVALQIREAQIFGLGARETSVTSDEFDKAYGVYIHRDDGTAEGSKTKTVSLFRDNETEDNVCDDGCSCTQQAGEECFETLTLTRNLEITSLMVVDIEGGVCQEVEALAVTFKRPNPDAIIVEALINPDDTRRTGVITVEANGIREHVVVRETGQISVVDDNEATDICANI